MKVYLVWHEWRDHDTYDYPEQHSEVVRAFSSQERAEAFVKAQPWLEDNNYEWGSLEIE